MKETFIDKIVNIVINSYFEFSYNNIDNVLYGLLYRYSYLLGII